MVVDEVDVTQVEVEVVADPCAPNPCTEAPLATCNYDRTAVETVTLPGRCSVVDGAASCDYDEAQELCPDGPCVLGGCVAVTDKCLWPYTPRVSYVTHLAFQSDEPCCHDFDGDGDDDNRFGDVLATVAPFIGSVDELLAKQIADRKMNMLLDFHGIDEPLADPVDDTRVDTLGYGGGFDAVRFVEPSTGLATFMLKLSSFVQEDEFIPRIRLAGSIDDGRWSGLDGRLSFILLGFEDAPTELVIERMGLAADVSLGPNGAGFDITGDGGRGGRLWGEVSRDGFLAALNTEFQYTCPCTLYSEDDGRAPIDIANNQCNEPESRPCEETEGICQALSDRDLCAGLLALLSADLDTDGDGINDALSVGMHFRATSAKVDWIQGCTAPPIEPE